VGEGPFSGNGRGSALSERMTKRGKVKSSDGGVGGGVSRSSLCCVG